MEVLVGRKPLKNYLNIVLIGLKTKGKVVIKARGNNIKKAIDTVEALKYKGINPKVDIKTDSAIFRGRLVSTIEIEVEG